MKILQKVDSIDVKRAFVISDFLSQQKYARRDMGHLTSAQYKKRLAHAKRVVLELPEMMLNMILAGEYKKRFRLYEQMDWYIGMVNTDEVGVWKHAGNLPLAWTRISLADTAEQVKNALAKHKRFSRGRAQTAIPGILKTALPYIQNDKYLLPIVLPGGTIGRTGLKKMRGDIDDGCMRAIALAVSGKKQVKMYIGKRKK